MFRTSLAGALALGLVLAPNASFALDLDPHVIPVGPDDTVQSAIWKAVPGDIVEVSGTHEEVVALPSGITVRGTPGAVLKTTLTAVGDVGFENLALEPLGREPVINLSGGLARVEACSIAGTLRVGGESTLSLANSHFAGGRLVLEDSALADVRSSTFENADEAAIAMFSRSAATISGIAVKGGAVGIRLSGMSHADLTAAVIAGCERDGILAEGNAQPSIRDTTLSGCRGAGLHASDSVVLAVTNSTASANVGPGIRAGGQATVLLAGNTCEKGQTSGIVFEGQAKGRVHDNASRANAQHGIAVFDLAAPELVGNLFQANEGSGMAFSGKVKAIARRNVCRSNAGSGLEVSSEAAPILEDDLLEENGQAGAEYWGQGGGKGVRLVARGNRASGIALWDAAAPVLTRCTLTANLEAGASFFGRSEGELTDSQATDNRGAGALVSDSAAPRLRHDVFSGNAVGLCYFNRARGTAQANLCRGNGSIGIQVGDTARPALLRNTVLAHRASGILILDGAAPRLEGNVVGYNRVGLDVERPGHQRGRPGLVHNLVGSNSVLDYSGLDAGPSDIVRPLQLITSPETYILSREGSKPDEGVGWPGP